MIQSIMIFKLLLDFIRKIGFIVPIAIGVVLAYIYLANPLTSQGSPSLIDMVRNINISEVSKIVSSFQNNNTTPTQAPSQWQSKQKVTFSTTPPTQFTLETAISSEQKQIGLMYRDNLETFQGMIFIFESDSNTGFWMKNVNFPLDIIFLDKDYKIIDLFENVPPCKVNDPDQRACPTYTSTTPYRYAIELKGKTISEFKINKETTISFDKN